jgi:hypothetical protein
MSKETLREIFVQHLDMRKLAAKLLPRNLREEQKGRHLTFVNGLCGATSRTYFLDRVSLVMKRGVIFMNPRPYASPWSADRRITPVQRSDTCRNLRANER